jgi:hypothetical protein
MYAIISTSNTNSQDVVYLTITGVTKAYKSGNTDMAQWADVDSVQAVIAFYQMTHGVDPLRTLSYVQCAIVQQLP